MTPSSAVGETLHLAPGLDVPIDIITETVAILGIRGSGKTNTAVVLAEELLARGQQVVVIDPTDAWWGLKSSADGKAAGYPVIVLGGRKAELPLGAGDGAAIADVVVDHGASLILALRHFESKADQRRFITDFAARLYYRKGQLDAPTPLMLIIDEASLVVPQNVLGESARMVGAIQQLVRQGRSSGIGVTLIDQRPASVNKDVLTQLEVLVCHRITSPQDRKALKDWVQQHDEHDRGPKFLESLASLEQGTAWIWSPGTLDVFKKVKIRARRTFDSSRTPKAGERVQAPTAFAPVDLDALRGQLAQTIEVARENDPKELRKEIARLERELSKPTRDGETIVPHSVMLSQVDAALAAQRRELETEIQQAIADEGARHDRYRKVLHAEIETLRGEAAAILGLVESLPARLDTVVARIDGILEVQVEDGGWIKPMPAPRPTAYQAARGESLIPAPAPLATTRPVTATNRADRATKPASRATPGADLSGPKIKILQSMVQLEAIGIPKPTIVQVALFTGVSHTTGSYLQNLRELAGDGFIMRESGRVSLIDTGRAAAGDVEIPTRRTLLDFWYKKLSGPQSKILRAVVDAHPGKLTLERLGASVGVSHTTGSYLQNVRDLDTYGLVERQRGAVKATELLFPRGLR